MEELFLSVVYSGGAVEVDGAVILAFVQSIAEIF